MPEQIPSPRDNNKTKRAAAWSKPLLKMHEIAMLTRNSTGSLGDGSLPPDDVNRDL